MFTYLTLILSLRWVYWFRQTD